MIIINDPRCVEYEAPGHPERPFRVKATLEKLKSVPNFPLEWGQPRSVSRDQILLAHSEHLLTRVDRGEGFDADTPSHKGIGDHGRRAVGGALEAMEQSLKGQKAFSLMRPPGHHATQDQAMGFCYFNSIAISVLDAIRQEKGRVAVFDFDVHHGNGTETILLNHPKAAFYSVHQHPCYPGTGTRHLGKNCFNYPVAPQTPRGEYRKILQTALDDLQKFKPDLIAVSAGFDAYARDPLAQETLEMEDFEWLGDSIRKLGVPAWSVLEGGYSNELPELILAYLKGWKG